MEIRTKRKYTKRIKLDVDGNKVAPEKVVKVKPSVNANQEKMAKILLKNGVDTLVILAVPSTVKEHCAKSYLGFGRVIALKVGIQGYVTPSGKSYAEVYGGNAVKGFNSKRALIAGRMDDMFDDKITWKTRLANAVQHSVILEELEIAKKNPPIVGTIYNGSKVYLEDGRCFIENKKTHCANCSKLLKGRHRLYLNPQGTKVHNMMPFEPIEPCVKVNGNNKWVHEACSPKSIPVPSVPEKEEIQSVAQTLSDYGTSEFSGGGGTMTISFSGTPDQIDALIRQYINNRKEN